jgi:hypothetical protein
VRAILANPRYTGRQVWKRQRRDDVLLDVEDVALGHVSKMRWNDEDAWIVSEALTHEPLVSDEQFHAVRTLAATGRRRPVVRETRPTSQPFALHGLVVCALCHRKMQGSANHGRAHYRCRYPSEYAIANELDHPGNVYVREDQILGPLDGWLAQVFDPGQLDTTLDALEAAASSTDDAGQAKAEAARRRVRHPPRPLPRRARGRHRSGGRQRLDRRGLGRAARRRGRAWPGDRTAEPPPVSRPARRAGEQPRQPARRARQRRAGGQGRGLPSPRAPAHLRPGPPGGDRPVAPRPRRRPRAVRRSEAGKDRARARQAPSTWAKVSVGGGT